MESGTVYNTAAKTLLNNLQTLKCLICLDVIENVRELPCQHIFCWTCLEGYRNGKDIIMCPLCKLKVSKRKLLNHDTGIDSLCVFIKKLCDDFKGHYMTDIFSSLNAMKGCSEVSGIEPHRQHVPEESVQQSSEENVIPCTFKIDVDKKLMIKTSKSGNVHKQRMEISSAQKTTNIDITKPTSLNKNETVETNSKGKSKRKLHSPIQKVVSRSFKSKTEILQWLHDSRNKFDRYSQTQYSSCQQNTPQDIISVPSASQAFKKTNSKNLDKRSSTLHDEVSMKRKARSVENLSQEEKKTLKRHSLECSSPSKVKQYKDLNDIEYIENQVIVDIIEDEVLDAIDKELCPKRQKGSTKLKENRCFVDNADIINVIEDDFLTQLEIDMEKTRNKSNALRDKGNTKVDKEETAKASWKSISKFKKTIGKPKGLKKLDISLQPTQKQNKKDDQLEPKLNITNLTGSSLTNIKNRTVDFQQMEDYFSKAIPEMIENSNKEISVEKGSITELKELKIVDKSEAIIIDTDDDSDKSDIYVYQTQPLSKNTNISGNDDMKDVLKIAKKLEHMLLLGGKVGNTDKTALSSIFPTIKNIFDIVSETVEEKKLTGIRHQNFDGDARPTSFSEKEIQTDIFSLDGFNISSTAFNSTYYKNATTQTLNFCLDCPHVDKENSDSTNINRESNFFQNISICESDKIVKVVPTKTSHSTESLINKSLLLQTQVSDMIPNKEKSSVIDIKTLGPVENIDKNSQVITKQKHTLLTNKDERKTMIEKVPPVSEMPIEDIINRCNMESEFFSNCELMKMSQPLENTSHTTKPALVVHKEVSESRDKHSNSQPGKTQENADSSDASAILYTLPSLKERANRKLIFEKAIKERSEIENTLKRVRTINSNMEDDEENPSIRICNRYVDDDFSIQFESESLRTTQYPVVHPDKKEEKVEHTAGQPVVSNHLVQSLNNEISQEIHGKRTQKHVTGTQTQSEALLKYCDELIEKNQQQIFKKDELSNHDQIWGLLSQRMSESSEKNETHRKCEEIEPQDLLKHYDNLIEKANQEIGRQTLNNNSGKNTNITKIKYVLSQKPSSSKQTNLSRESDRMNGDIETKTLDLLEHCNALIGKNIERDDLKISDNHENDKIESQVDDEFFCRNMDQLDLVLKDVNKNEEPIVSKESSESVSVIFSEKSRNKNLKCVIEQMEDSFDMACKNADLAEFCTPKRKNSGSDSENVTKKPKISQKLLPNKKNQPSTKSDNFNSSDDEMFSDIDVVETTPQKQKNRSFLEKLSCSQALHKNSRTPTNLLEVEPNCSTNIDIVPPPPGFGDTEDNEEDRELGNILESVHATTQRESENIIPNSLSPEKIQIAPHRKALTSSNSKKLNLSKDILSLSEQFTQVSPICQEKTKSLIEMVRQSKFSPLTIVPRTTPVRSPLTSTPKQKSILSYITPSETKKAEHSSSQTAIPERTKPCVAYTRLTNPEILGVRSLCKELATLRNTFGPDVTHMIVSVDKNNCVKDHTSKFVLAVSAGLWVLNSKWIQKCLEEHAIVDEEPFEVLDISGIPSPRISRLSRLQNPLFKGYKFHISPPFLNITLEDTEKIIKLLAGDVVSSIEDFSSKQGSICIIISESSNSTENYEQYQAWVETYRVATVDIHWLILSVARYKIQSLKPHIICPDDCLDELGYPPAITIDVPSSFTQDTYSM